jgi:hypothetical protein
LSPCTTRRATPSKGDAERARSTAGGPSSRTSGAVASSLAQRSQRTSSDARRAVPQAAQSGGATREAI